MDPLKLSATFIMQFLFIYGSQPSNFFTQNLGAGLLTAAQERNMLRESAQAYHATHVNYTTPHSSTTWPPEPVLTLPELLAAPAVQPNATHRHDGWVAQTNAPRWYPQYSPPEEANHYATPYQSSWHIHYATTHNGWQSTPAWSWWQDNQSTGWNWSPQPGWTATWHWN